MIISPCVLLVPAAADKESMSHPHKHEPTNTHTHTHTHTHRAVFTQEIQYVVCMF